MKFKDLKKVLVHWSLLKKLLRFSTNEITWEKCWLKRRDAARLRNKSIRWHLLDWSSDNNRPPTRGITWMLWSRHEVRGHMHTCTQEQLLHVFFDIWAMNNMNQNCNVTNLGRFLLYLWHHFDDHAPWSSNCMEFSHINKVPGELHNSFTVTVEQSDLD